MTEMAIGVLLAALGAWVVIGSFSKSKASDNGSEISRLVEEKANIYRSIIELERDHDEGKVSDADKKILTAQYERNASRILRELDKAASSATKDVLEEEIAAARKRLRRD